jgi:hypothetical protein
MKYSMVYHHILFGSYHFFYKNNMLIKNYMCENYLLKVSSRIRVVESINANIFAKELHQIQL